MLVMGDVHGNRMKVKAFLDYKPEEQHCFVGDYFDSFIATIVEQIDTFKMIVDSGAIMLTGNHDIQYFKTADRRVICSGYTANWNIIETIDEFKNKLKCAHYEDGFVISHGGFHPMLFPERKDPMLLVDTVNEQFETYKAEGIDGIGKTNLFNIGSVRGGWNQFGGVFWLDYKHEKLNYNFNQIIGHTKTVKGITPVVNHSKYYVPVDTTKFECWNTKTLMVEDFFPSELEKDRIEMERCY